MKSLLVLFSLFPLILSAQINNNRDDLADTTLPPSQKYPAKKQFSEMDFDDDDDNDDLVDNWEDDDDFSLFDEDDDDE